MRLAGQAAVFLGAMLPLAMRGEIDQVALLNRARAKIAENIQRLPKYTCVQTVHRSRYDAVPALRMSGCGDVENSSAAKLQPRRMLASLDRFKLDVTVSGGAELFSWAGAQRFQSEDVEKIVGGGMTGTGDFGPFLSSVFAGGASDYDYLGLEQEKGRALAVYRYHVPASASHYQIKIGSWPEDVTTLAYEGKVWIDPQDAELSRMTIEVPDPPRESETCRIETAIDYQRARISGSDFLLPGLTVVQLWDSEGAYYENRIEYSGCRKFQSESVFRTEPEPSAGDSVVSKKPVAIPAGIVVKIALRSQIDLQNAFAGDAIEGLSLNPIRAHDGSILAPGGAIVHGRIVRFEHRYRPSNYFALGLKFHSIDVNGSEVPLPVAAVTRSRVEKMLAGPLERSQGIGMYMFRSDRLVLDHKFVSEWKTTAGKQAE